jgi:hypothetical protein
MEKVPQNLIVEGLSSKIFTINFLHNLNKDDHQLFVESILSDFMDNLGDTFKATICLQLHVQDTYNKSYISIEYNEYKWLYDISQRISIFLDKINNKLKFVSVGINGRSINNNNHNHIIFTLLAKDGIYLEKKCIKTEQIIKTINDNSGFSGSKYAEYIPNIYDF